MVIIVVLLFVCLAVRSLITCLAGPSPRLSIDGCSMNPGYSAVNAVGDVPIQTSMHAPSPRVSHKSASPHATCLPPRSTTAWTSARRRPSGNSWHTWPPTGQIGWKNSYNSLQLKWILCPSCAWMRRSRACEAAAHQSRITRRPTWCELLGGSMMWRTHCPLPLHGLCTAGSCVTIRVRGICEAAPPAPGGTSCWHSRRRRRHMACHTDGATALAYARHRGGSTTCPIPTCGLQWHRHQDSPGWPPALASDRIACTSFYRKLTSRCVAYEDDFALQCLVHDIALARQLQGITWKANGMKVAPDSIARSQNFANFWTDAQKRLEDMCRQHDEMPNLFFTVAPAEWTFPLHRVMPGWRTHHPRGLSGAQVFLYILLCTTNICMYSYYILSYCFCKYIFLYMRILFMKLIIYVRKRERKTDTLNAYIYIYIYTHTRWSLDCASATCLVQY